MCLIIVDIYGAQLVWPSASLKKGVKHCYLRIWLVIEEEPGMKGDNTKVNGGTNTKGRHFQQSKFSQKANFKAPSLGLEDKVFDFGKQEHASEFTNNCKDIARLSAVNYKHVGPDMDMAINNTKNPDITLTDAPDNTSNKIKIFIW